MVLASRNGGWMVVRNAVRGRYGRSRSNVRGCVVYLVSLLNQILCVLVGLCDLAR